MSDGRIEWLADVMADAFRGVSGYRVVAESGWESRGRAALYPRGTMNHHTGGGSASWANQKAYITHGSSIAPLANYGTSRPSGGVVEIAVIAAGKANHSGLGYLPWTGRDRGNNYLIGGEYQNDGRQAWPGQQVEGIRIANAALLTKIGQGVDRMVDHKTYAPTRKVDRHSTSVAAERRAVAALMDGETDMALSAAEETTVRELHAAVKRVNSDGSFAEHAVILIRALRSKQDGIEFADQLEDISEEMDSNPGFLREVILHLRNHPPSGASITQVRAIAREEAVKAVAASGGGDVDLPALTDLLVARIVERLRS